MLLGAHESIAGGVSRAFARAEAHGAKSLQLFTKTARGWKAPPLADAERALFRDEAQRSKLPAIAHGSYLVNLGTEDVTLRGRSIECLLDELSRCEALGIPYLVIHPGGHPDEKTGLRQIARGLDEVHAATEGYAARICLENTAGQGSNLGWAFEHLAEILSQVRAPERLGICLDTCHLFAAGHDLSTEQGYARVMADFDARVGLDRVRCFHLNDCKKPLGCRVDRHEEIGEGTLGLECFRALVNDPRFAQTVGVLETPNPEHYPAALAKLRALERDGGPRAEVDVKADPPARNPSRPVAQLSARGKLERLSKVAKGRKSALVLTHDNPDPDAIASGLALGEILSTRFGVKTVVAYGGIIGRSENLAMVKVLSLPVVPVSRIVFDDYDLVALVDTQPSIGNHPLPPSLTADLVIDHHPMRDESLRAPFADVGGDYGATSTMLVEYLRAAHIEPSPTLATALFYGIKSDTRDLGRQTTDSDVTHYIWLFPKVDKERLAKIEHPDLPARYFRLYHQAIERARLYGDAVVTDLGDVYSPDMVAEVAERMLFLEGTRWSLAFGTFRDQIYFSVRTQDPHANAGKLIREICADRGGSSGGHDSMAGARLPLPTGPGKRKTFQRELLDAFLKGLGVEGERPRPLLDEGA